ncbi:MAG: efflux RND transporter periplasmic adaptor subunit, partial [Steroidobacteraceae bacterium]
MDQPARPDDATHGFVPAASPRARRMLRAGGAVALIAVAGVAWIVHSRHRAAQALALETQSQALVAVATAQPEPVGGAGEIVLPGNLEANYEAPIYARTSGYLGRWLVDIGARVRKGQLHAKIDAPEVDQQLREAQADLATAEANREIAEVTATHWRHLRETDSVSKQEADEKLSAAQASAAQV